MPITWSTVYLAPCHPKILKCAHAPTDPLKSIELSSSGPFSIIDGDYKISRFAVLFMISRLDKVCKKCGSLLSLSHHAK